MISRNITLEFSHRVLFTRDLFACANPVLGELIGAEHGSSERPAKFLVFVDSSVLEVDPGLPRRVAAYCDENGGLIELATPVVGVPGGEVAKNHWKHVKDIWSAINRYAIDRHCYVLAIGGGAVLDLVGFAASTAHRGIRHIRMPTTTLSQGDGGVGVKNGVNYFGKKNWIGTFSVPFAVINDFNFIKLLPEKEKRAGIIEAIKVALIKDRDFFEEMEAEATALGALEDAILERVIQRSAELHVDHIASAGDPFECGSARPLDFGHWAAHKIEQISAFELGHGEAVAVGIALDLLYSVRAGLLGEAAVERVLSLIESVGFSLFSEHLEAEDADGRKLVVRGLEEFREHLGGKLTITLVPEIGSKIEVHEMDARRVEATIQDLRQRVVAKV